MIGLILWSVFLVVLTLIINNAVLEYNRNKKIKETEFRTLNRRTR